MLLPADEVGEVVPIMAEGADVGKLVLGGDVGSLDGISVSPIAGADIDGGVVTVICSNRRPYNDNN